MQYFALAAITFRQNMLCMYALYLLDYKIVFAEINSIGISITLSSSEPVLSGRKVNLTCSVSGALISAITWFRNDTYIGEDDYVDPAYRSMYSADVIQSNVTYRLIIYACDYARDNTTWRCASAESSGIIDLPVKGKI